MIAYITNTGQPNFHSVVSLAYDSGISGLRAVDLNFIEQKISGIALSVATSSTNSANLATIVTNTSNTAANTLAQINNDNVTFGLYQAMPRLFSGFGPTQTFTIVPQGITTLSGSSSTNISQFKNVSYFIVAAGIVNGKGVSGVIEQSFDNGSWAVSSLLTTPNTGLQVVQNQFGIQTNETFMVSFSRFGVYSRLRTTNSGDVGWTLTVTGVAGI